jgi:hypothetical protein
MKEKLIIVLIAVILGVISLSLIDSYEGRVSNSPEPTPIIFVKKDTLKFDSNTYKIKELKKRIDSLEKK